MKRRDVLAGLGSLSVASLTGCTVRVPERLMNPEVQVVAEETVEPQTESNTPDSTPTATDTPTVTETSTPIETPSPSDVYIEGYVPYIPQNNPCPEVVGAARTYEADVAITNSTDKVVTGTVYIDFMFDTHTSRVHKQFKTRPESDDNVHIARSFTCDWNPDTVELDVFLDNLQFKP